MGTGTIGKRLAVALSVLLLAGCGDDNEPPSAPAPQGPSSSVVLDAVTISSVPEAENFQHARARVNFGRSEVARATLSVALESPCFPFDKWTPETVPAGHAFPLRCDAFDRTFIVSLDDPAQPEVGPPGIELARAITPFGGPMAFDVDVTDVVNGLLGAHVLNVDIQTWGDASGQVTGAEGEWIVSVALHLEPGRAPRKVAAVLPIFFGNFSEASPASFNFSVPSNATSARLEYRATGHGGGAIAPGCVGPAEEFCRRNHAFALDGVELESVLPWRSDCETLCTSSSYASDFLTVPEYCAENPCGLPASVRAPRANWCPGSLSEPFIFESTELSTPGAHELGVAIDEVAEGGLWTLSALLLAFE